MHLIFKKSRVDEVLSKLLDNNLVSNKKTLAVLDSFWVMTEETGVDQIQFSISDSDKNLLEHLTDDSQGIADCSEVSTAPPINTVISYITTEFAT